MTELEKCEIIQEELERIGSATTQLDLEYRNSLRRYLLLMLRPNSTPPPEPLTQGTIDDALVAKAMPKLKQDIDKAIASLDKPIPNTDRLARALDKLIPKEEDSAPGTHIPNL